MALIWRPWVTRRRSGSSPAEAPRSQLTRRLESDLPVAGHRMVRVPTKLMAGARRSAREPCKSDPIYAAPIDQFVRVAAGHPQEKSCHPACRPCQILPASQHWRVRPVTPTF